MHAVEEKLNELLDTEGGISKRKVRSFNDMQLDYLNLVVLIKAVGRLMFACMSVFMPFYLSYIWFNHFKLAYEYFVVFGKCLSYLLFP